MRLHQLLLGTVRAQNVRSVGDEAASHQTGLATGAHEAIVMPVTLLERDEASAADAYRERERKGVRQGNLAG